MSHEVKPRAKAVVSPKGRAGVDPVGRDEILQVASGLTESERELIAEILDFQIEGLVGAPTTGAGK